MLKLFFVGKMPRTLLALWVALSLLAVGLGAGHTASAFAATPVTVGGKAIVTNTGGDPIRIRQGAGTEFAQLSVAYQGQTVTVLAGPTIDKKGMKWFKVQAPAATGWMSADFLQGVVSSTSTSTSSTKPATTKLTGSAIVANTNGDPLRMRSIASTSGKVLTLLSPGAKVTIQSGPLTDDAGTSWYGVAAQGYTGWVMAQYLAQAGSSTDIAAKTEILPDAKAVVESKPAVVVAVATATPKPASQPKATTTLGQYRQWMEEARVMYPYKQTLDKMWSVMICESGGNYQASNGGRYLGLFQYAPGTWGGSWNPYRGSSIWDAKSQIFATAKAWSIGMQSAWSCYYITAGR